MADEPKPPDGPHYPPTKQIPRVQVQQTTLDAVLSEVRAMRTETTERFDKIETTVDTLVEDGKAANQRMTKIEIRLDTYEERGAKHSGGLTRASEVDAKHDAAIANLITEVADTKALVVAGNADTAELTREAKEFFKKNPAIAQGLLTLIGLAITAAVTWLQARGH